MKGSRVSTDDKRERLRIVPNTSGGTDKTRVTATPPPRPDTRPVLITEEPPAEEPDAPVPA
jgi:hypothetical protein